MEIPMKWREMTLTEAYPYWILGDVPPQEIPYIAYNDLLAGNEAEEIVELAGLTPSEAEDGWEFDRVLTRAVKRLGLPLLTQAEAAQLVALDKMREIARQIVAGEVPPVRGANAIYVCLVDAGFPEAADLDELIVYYGLEFLHMTDVLEEEDLIIEAAKALLAGRPLPEWK